MAKSPRLASHPFLMHIEKQVRNEFSSSKTKQSNKKKHRIAKYFNQRQHCKCFFDIFSCNENYFRNNWLPNTYKNVQWSYLICAKKNFDELFQRDSHEPITSQRCPKTIWKWCIELECACVCARARTMENKTSRWKVYNECVAFGAVIINNNNNCSGMPWNGWISQLVFYVCILYFFFSSFFDKWFCLSLYTWVWILVSFNSHFSHWMRTPLHFVWLLFYTVEWRIRQ